MGTIVYFLANAMNIINQIIDNLEQVNKIREDCIEYL